MDSISTLAAWAYDAREKLKSIVRTPTGDWPTEDQKRLRDEFEYVRDTLRVEATGEPFEEIFQNGREHRKRVRRLKRENGGQLPEAQDEELWQEADRNWRSLLRRAAVHDNPDEAYRIAVHEAGHLVQHFADGDSPSEARIKVERDGEELRLDGGACSPGLNEDGSAAAHLAGVAAEAVFGYDEREARRYSGTDLKRAGEQGDPERALRKAKKTIRTHGRAVQLIADELAEFGHISGPDAEAIFREHRGQRRRRRGNREPRTVTYAVGRSRRSRPTEQQSETRTRRAWPASRR